MIECDVFIIGGGPAGSIAAIKLRQAGYRVQVVEKVKFPRFVIGESLLPRCSELLECAGVLNAVEKSGFQFKGGVTFANEKGDRKIIDFSQNSGEKHNSSFQVRREVFDNLLLEKAKAAGAQVTMEAKVIKKKKKTNIITVHNKEGREVFYHAKKVIDASGYGRVLPLLLDLDIKSTLQQRDAIFCRVEHDNRVEDVSKEGYIDVYIVGNNDAWIWNIPLSETITSVGIVCSDEYYRSFNMDQADFWNYIISKNPQAKERYANAIKINEVGFIGGYSSNVKSMFGDNYVMVGNATEFLDPVFSSGVTLALESGSKAADLIIKEFKGSAVDWQTEYEDYMMVGVNVFREYVEAWYDGRLQSILFSDALRADKIERKIVSVLSGYVWDENNMFVYAPTEAVNKIYEVTKE